MAYYRHPLDVPALYQWDESSKLPLPPYPSGTAPGNCGVTVVTHMAEYYTDRRSGIYATRRLVISDNYRMSTTVGEQSHMLALRGVPNVIDRPSIAGLHRLLATGRRPIGIGMNFAQVPYDIAGHPFRGGHGIELRASVRNGQGFSAMDPNFNRTYRTDPTGGKRFYPNWVLEVAYYRAGYWAIVPIKDKQVPPPWYGRIRVDGAGVSIRESAKEIPGNVWAKSHADGWTYTPAGRRLFRSSYQYHWDGEIRTSSEGVPFYVVRTHARNGKFIRVGAAVVVRKA